MEAPEPGFLLCQDTYFVGSIKGVGKIYMQSVVDAHCSLGFGKLYLSKAAHDGRGRAPRRRAALLRGA